MKKKNSTTIYEPLVKNVCKNQHRMVLLVKWLGFLTRTWSITRMTMVCMFCVVLPLQYSLIRNTVHSVWSYLYYTANKFCVVFTFTIQSSSNIRRQTNSMPSVTPQGNS